MTDDIKAFIKKHSAKRDLYISSKVDETYLEPMYKAWKGNGVGKREIILLGMVIGYKLEKIGKIKYVTDCNSIGENKGKLKDMGQLGDFNDKDLSLILSLCIAKYEVDETISQFDKIMDELRVLSEKGIANLPLETLSITLVKAAICIMPFSCCCPPEK